MKRKNMIAALVGGTFTFIVMALLGFQNQKPYYDYHSSPNKNSTTEITSNNTESVVSMPQESYPNFTDAAEKSINAVVHIQTTYNQKPSLYDFFYDFFERRQFSQPQGKIIASGSGVIISNDGYIVTNNHVVHDAEDIEVSLNDKRVFKAKIIGTDPTTDLALIKIEASNLPFLTYGDSDKVKVGEWVLAVGNPFNLTSTVTSGIVSAKARNINILGSSTGEKNTIESFIQTDAAINKGNSGGALVNTRGELIGINAAIASGTGYYTGYSFAIPANIVKKVADDLLQFGKVERGYIGVQIRELNAKLAEEKNIKNIEGVYVEEITSNGAAKKAGIKSGDIILAIEGKKINSTSEFIGIIGQYRPGDHINITVNRNEKNMDFRIKLTNQYGNSTLTDATPEDNTIELFGATITNANNQILKKLGLTHGIQITDLKKDSKFAAANIKKGFIITRIDKVQVSSLKELQEILAEKRGGILIEGVYPNGTIAYYGFGL